jgi:tetratricopeptide (TPR) repeat protein
MDTEERSSSWLSNVFLALLFCAGVALMLRGMLGGGASEGPQQAGAPAPAAAAQRARAVREPAEPPARPPARAALAQTVSPDELAPPPDTRREGVDAFGYPRATADKLQILELLRGRRYRELDELFESYLTRTLDDVRFEYFLTDGFDAFNVPDPELEALLSGWVESLPRSAHALVARGEHSKAMGWAARGGAYAAETSEAQWQGMRRSFTRAIEDVREALELRPEHLAGYAILKSIARTDGDDAAFAAVQARELELSPDSFVVGTMMMYALLPRWGGSHAAMDRVAAAALARADRNPRLRVLQGYKAWDQGDRAVRAERYEDAIGHFTEALAYGDHWLFRKDRAHVYSLRKEYERALEDLNAAVELRPQNAKVLEMRGTALHWLALRMRDPKRRRALAEASLRDQELSLALDPTDERVRENRDLVRQFLARGCRCP